MNFRIQNAKIITPYRIISGSSLLVSNGKIIGIGNDFSGFENVTTIDAKGQYLSPGFIDLHVHGGGGADFMDADIASFLLVAKTHARHGTTSMCPTTLTSSKADLLRTLDIYEKANEVNDDGARFLGMHLEGPYISLAQAGAQDARYIRNPDPGEYREVLAHSKNIRRWSAAPELSGSMEFAKWLRHYQVLPAIAHTDAVYEEVVEAFENGFTLATHFYSAMSGVTRRNAYRHAGVIETAYLLDEMDVEIIADGYHLPPSLLRLIYQSKGPGRIALITDAMRAAGTDATESVLGSKHSGINVIVENGVAKMPDRASFAGSVATADRLVRTMIQQASVPLTDAIRMITSTPARILGLLDTKGTIAVGKDADLVIFDSDVNISLTMVNGKTIYNKLFPELENI
jgi:N-acetylglucosamine-6-phosphate deacetylase